MDILAEDSLHEAQKSRLERFGVSRCVDMHCHCLPGLDDGPTTMDEAIALCRMLVDDGITTVIATPHQFGRYDRDNPAEKIRNAVEELTQHLAGESIPLELLPGADIRLDERICTLLDADEVATLADGKKYLLLELPHELFVDPRMLLMALEQRGVRPILSHPERHHHLQQSPHLIKPWLNHGALIQITAGSLTGDFGQKATQAAWGLVQDGSASLVATDAHGPHQRCPCLTKAIESISLQMGQEVARSLCLTNPLKILEGLEIETNFAR